MRATSIGAVLTGAPVLSASAVTAPAAYAAETGVVIQKVSVNGGKPIALGTSQTESFTISATASDDSGISTKLAFLQIKREVGDSYWSYHGSPKCTASSATTSTCKLTVKLDSGWGVPRSALAGPWKVVVQLQSKDGDLYNNGGDITHPVLRRGKLSVDAGPEPVTKGKWLKVTRKLTRANGDRLTYAGDTNQSVKLQFRKAGTSTYKTVKTVRPTRRATCRRRSRLRPTATGAGPSRVPPPRRPSTPQATTSTCADVPFRSARPAPDRADRPGHRPTRVEVTAPKERGTAVPGGARDHGHRAQHPAHRAQRRQHPWHGMELHPEHPRLHP
ncbi:calcium-binding protein [Streptomyces sp. NPDC048295]|uniref:calcium-binding protein n=1 Tax=Streptomyces sp. NPDC048295 TaxID=3154617 RepID=UPI00342E2D67